MNHKPKGMLTNGFYAKANHYRKFPINEDEIEKQNITEQLYAELEYMVSHGEIISINANAKMRLGKSTLILMIGQIIFELLKKYGKR